jgi:hypothetical protein
LEAGFGSIVDLEKHLHRNATQIIKIFLHLSYDEQRKRFLERIDEPEKNWKFSTADIHERKYWKHYMKAYEDSQLIRRQIAVATFRCFGYWRTMSGVDLNLLFLHGDIEKTLQGIHLFDDCAVSDLADSRVDVSGNILSPDSCQPHRPEKGFKVLFYNSLLALKFSLKEFSLYNLRGDTPLLIVKKHICKRVERLFRGQRLSKLNCLFDPQSFRLKCEFRLQQRGNFEVATDPPPICGCP